MFTTLIVLQVLIAIGLIAIVLVQRGPGATMGAAFGAGASGTVFGSRGAGNFLTRTTGWLALGFFAISLALAVLATGVARVDESGLGSSVMQQQAARQQAADDPSSDDQAASIDSVIETLESGADEAPPAEPPAELAGDGEQAAEDDGSSPSGG